MENSKDDLLNLVKRANRLGARGIEVIDFKEISAPTDSISFITIRHKSDESIPATGRPWYDK